AQYLANSQYILLYNFRIYIRFRPERFQNFFLGHQPIRILDQIAKDIEGLWRQGHAFFSPPKGVVHAIQPEFVKKLHQLRKTHLLGSGQRTGRLRILTVYGRDTAFSLPGEEADATVLDSRLGCMVMPPQDQNWTETSPVGHPCAIHFSYRGKHGGST